MAVKSASMGKLEDGREVKVYTLTNAKGTEAAFLDFGAIWYSMLVKDKDGKQRDMLLGSGDLKILPKNPGHMGEVVGRNANRIGGAIFTLNGKTYSLAVNDNNANNLHSGPDYWRLRSWQAETGESEQGSYVRFSLHSPDGDQGYPGNADVTVTYTLSAEDAVHIHYEGSADQDTVFNLTNHAYFNVAGQDSGSVLDHLVWLNADSFTPADALSIPTGEIRPVEGTPMDFRTAKPVGQDIGADFDQLNYAKGYDHNWCLNDADGSVRLVGSVYAEESGIKMEIYTDLEGVQFYTANYLEEPGVGKGGRDYHIRDAYCFETQHYPDAVNKPDFPTPFVKAGEKYETETIYRFTLA